MASGMLAQKTLIIKTFLFGYTPKYSFVPLIKLSYRIFGLILRLCSVVCSFRVWNIYSYMYQNPYMLCKSVSFTRVTAAITVFRIWFICVEKHKSKLSLGPLPAGDQSWEQATGRISSPLTSMLEKLTLMAWFNNPLAMTTCSLFSPSEMLFARKWTGGRLRLLVLMLSCCHAHRTS